MSSSPFESTCQFPQQHPEREMSKIHMKPNLVFNPAEAVSTIWHWVEALNGDHIVRKLDPFLKHSSDPFFSILLVQWFTQKNYMYVCIHTCTCLFRTLIFNNPSVLRVIYFLIEQPAVFLLGLYIHYSFGNMVHFICVQRACQSNPELFFFDCIWIWR